MVQIPKEGAVMKTPKSMKTPKKDLVEKVQTPKSVKIEKTKTPKTDKLKTPKIEKLEQAKANNTLKSKAAPVEIIDTPRPNKVKTPKSHKKEKLPKSPVAQMASPSKSPVKSDAEMKSPKAAAPKQEFYTAMATNLNFDTQRDTLMEHFSEFGPVAKLNMPTRNDGNNKGVAFVSFQSRDIMKEVLITAHKVDGRMLTVSLSVKDVKEANTQDSKKRKAEDDGQGSPAKKQMSEDPTKVFVDGLDKNLMNHDSIKKTFSRFGKVVNIVTPRMHPKARSGTAVIKYEDHESVQKALSAKTVTVGNRTLNIRPKLYVTPPTSYELFVGRISKKAKFNDIKTYFEQFGGVAQVKYRQEKRMAFVCFSTEEGLKAALAKTSHSINDAEVIVQKKRDDTDAGVAKKSDDKAAKGNKKLEAVKKEEMEEEEDEDSEDEDEGEEEEDSEEEDEEMEDEEEEDSDEEDDDDDE